MRFSRIFRGIVLNFISAGLFYARNAPLLVTALVAFPMSNLGLALSHLPITPDGFPKRRPGPLPRSPKAVGCMLMNGGVPVRRRNASEAGAGLCRERVPHGPPSTLAGCQLDAVYISPAVGTQTIDCLDTVCSATGQLKNMTESPLEFEIF